MINTTLCYIEKDASYLMLHRVKKQNDLNKDKWIGIGGKFEEGESPEECILREALEETGLTLNKAEYRGIVTFVSDDSEHGRITEFMHIFWCGDFSGDLKVCDEGNLEWVPKEKINDLPHWKGDEIFLDLLDREKHPDQAFFSLKLEYTEGELKRAVLDGKEINW
ncbi:MAG: 8-oxo-dGTP diphosphatase [Treponema sp.]|nr:8-oxo-dGTP diphosphatase [Treponema sp.]